MTDIKRGFVEGKLFLFEKPEMLAREDHWDLGISPVDAPFANTRTDRAIPLTLTEFTTAQKHYPIVFTSMEQPVPLAIVGVIEDDNLFLDGNNQWDTSAYLPAYLRSYPFAFAQHGEEQMAVVFDRAAAMINNKPVYPFFNGDEVSEHTQKLTDFAGRYFAERRRTEEFCKRLLELDLLTGQHITNNAAEGETPEILANYVGIDGARLTGLDKDTIYDLHTTGLLATIYAQIQSMENWTHLFNRRAAKLAT